MNKEKLTPKDKKEIVMRVAAGEKQAGVALDFGITQGYLSKIVKQSRAGAVKEKSDALDSRVTENVSGKTADQLCNRYRQLHMELLRHNDELQQRLLESDSLQRSIEVESQKDGSVRDEGWILAQKKRLTWCQDTSQTGYEMARLYQESSAILQTFAKRGAPIPVGVSILNGLIPASKTK